MITQNLIYGLVDPRTLGIRYVGKSSSGLIRPKAHRNNASRGKTYSAAWIRDLLSLDLVYEIVVLEELVPGATTPELDERECWWISYGRISGWALTNLTDGGGGIKGFKASDETKAIKAAQATRQFSTPEARAQHGAITKQAMAEIPEESRARMIANSRKVAPALYTPAAVAKRSGDLHYMRQRPEARELVRKRMTGRKLSPETIEKIRASRTGFTLSEEARAKIGEGQNRWWANATPEQIEERSKANRGRPVSDEQREAMRIRATGVVPSDETRAKLRATWELTKEARRESFKRGWITRRANAAKKTSGD